MNVNHLQPGMIALQSNRTESLAEALVAWLQNNPLGPLEEEVILVQSNAMAEWVKMALADWEGVCAATRVELPSRFMWRTYRQVLGRHAVASQSPLDKFPLSWRLMALLPQLLDEPAFAPVASFLHSDPASRLYPLASRLADLFDQYQVYRPDWLALWANGQDVLCHPNQAALSVPPEQLWQPQLWRALMAQLDDHGRASGRPMLHQRVLDHLRSNQPTALPVARRVVAFGMTQLPQAVLQLFAAMAGHSQVILALPNPCRFHWADIMDGRELHRQIRRRRPLRDGHDLATLPLEALHAHAHPLLAAWGRQGRDFVRQTDAFDEEQQALGHADVIRVDLFEETTPSNASLLQQVQAHIRDLLPLTEHPKVDLPESDQSIVFHVAHNLVRELEVLHDHLLTQLARQDSSNPLQAREVVVMLPAIEVAAPAIRAVFGQYRTGDARYIPFDIADLSTKSVSPLVLALEWALRLPTQRCTQSELRDFLSQTSVAARFGLDPDDLPRLMQWLEGAGVRWGLDAQHRANLGLALCGEPNTSLFGLRRMLMGYATGLHNDLHVQAFANIEPYGEVGGLDAELAGGFAHLLETLSNWQQQSLQVQSPIDWATQFRGLLAALFKAHNTEDQKSLAALEQALQTWLNACDLAQFDQPIALDVARTAWLEALDENGLDQRFRAGGVTFCTMMPMRAIPFQVVCLLGMNEQDYPRRAHRSDFDLMGLPGQFRPGDRARRDDDRQLMLEALLSARRQLLVSWTGRSVRDNTEMPPSVLVSQLRDYLRAGWGASAVASRTTEHPLQPFSRRYFEPGSGLVTYAREWRAAHDLTTVGANLAQALPASDHVAEPFLTLNVEGLQQFLRNPVRAFFRHRLDVVFDAISQGELDEEVFALGGLGRYAVVRQLADDCLRGMQSPATEDVAGHLQDPEPVLQHALRRLERAGQLPMAGVGRLTVVQLEQALLPMLKKWQALDSDRVTAPDRQHLRYVQGAVVLEDWMVCAVAGQWVRLEPMALTEKKHPDQVRPERVLQSWLISLLASANGTPVVTHLIGLDATVLGMPMEPEKASEVLQMLLELWEQGMAEPLPLPFNTAWVARRTPNKAAITYDGGYMVTGEVDDACLRRVYTDFESLVMDGRFESLSKRLMTPLLDWIDQSVRVLPHVVEQDLTIEGTE